jgi:hypothetical protein
MLQQRYLSLAHLQKLGRKQVAVRVHVSSRHQRAVVAAAAAARERERGRGHTSRHQPPLPSVSDAVSSPGACTTPPTLCSHVRYCCEREHTSRHQPPLPYSSPPGACTTPPTFARTGTRGAWARTGRGKGGCGRGHTSLSTPHTTASHPLATWRRLLHGCVG